MGSRTFLDRLLPPLLLVLAVGVLYAQTARHQFVEYDTSVYLTANPRVLAGLSLDGARWVFTHFLAANWHPLTWLSHMLDVELFGLRPAGHQLENAAWHATNALLVLALFTRLGLSRAFAFAGALLFAVHPLRVESVAWIVERKDLLCAFFGLASLLAWLSWSRDRAAWKLAAALALYACSLMSKSMLVTLPCLLVLLEWWPLGRTSWRPRRSDLATLAFLALALGSAILTVRAQASFGAVQGFSTWPLALRIENSLEACVWYLAHTIWPAGLAFFYPWARHELQILPLLLAAALLGALGLGAWRARGRQPVLLFGWLWFVVTLVPVIGLVQVGAQAHADRYTYLPCLGLILALCCVAERELLPRLGGRALAALGALAALALFALSWRQIGYWRDTEALALHALDVTRDNNVACDLLGSYYSNNGRLDEALPLLREALRITPGDPDAQTNLGGTLLRHGELAESEKLLLLATEGAPRHWRAWSLLGGLYLAQQRYEEALRMLDRALALEPEHGGSWLNRGRALEALGRLEEARQSYERALERPEDPWTGELTLGRLLLRLGRAEDARPHFERVLAHEPRQLDALRGLERVELARGALPEAWKLAQTAAALRPDDAPILADEAWILALATQGPLAQPKAALELAERALRAGGAQPALLDAYAFACAANGDFERAIGAAEQALALGRGADPDWAARLERRLAAYRDGRVDRESAR
jgi:tetratricopeptide (TPR) repeat protein